MFTGIVEELGEVVTIEPVLDGARIRVAASKVLDGVAEGDSMAVNGCCLTVVASGTDWFEADLTAETLDRTSLRGVGAHDRVNLERPVRLADRLGGHLVQGHVDTVGEVVDPPPNLRVWLDPELARYVVEKGSVTVDGVSLTAVEADDDSFTVAVIPHTAAVTTLGGLGEGDPVNVEVDVIGKYVERLLPQAWAGPVEKGPGEREP